MKRVFKKYFIPHEHNDYQPHFLRPKSILLVGAVVLLSELLLIMQVFVIGPHSNFLALILPSVVSEETNAVRADQVLIPLKVSSALQRAAQLKANDMAANGYFAHKSPAGLTPWHWFSEAGYSFIYAGENLAVNFSDSKDVITAWMNSPSHKANILNPNFTEIGVAMAKGIYKGKEATFVVQMFGRPMAIAAAAKPASSVIKESKVIEQSSTAKDSSQEMFVAVKGAEAMAAEVPKEINNSDNQVEPAPGLFATVLASPRNAANVIFLIIGAIVTGALFLKILVKPSIQHPKLIVGGLSILIMIGGALILNQHLILAAGLIF